MCQFSKFYNTNSSLAKVHPKICKVNPNKILFTAGTNNGVINYKE